MRFDDICNTALGLGVGCLVKQENFTQLDHHQQNKKKLFLKNDHFLPFLLSLGPSDENATRTDTIDAYHQHQASAAASSFSNSSVKKERNQEVELERVSSRLASDEEEDGSPRKKLRLTKQQSSILEHNFKQHTTLNTKQKQALAEQLNLRPRQVEVWFQNRRARTKLKQTEVDCELLNKCYEALTEENKRLQKELQELKALKLAASYCMPLLETTGTLTMCPRYLVVTNLDLVGLACFLVLLWNIWNGSNSKVHNNKLQHHGYRLSTQPPFNTTTYWPGSRHPEEPEMCDLLQ
ncbi:Homeobox-leucine zipper protein HOX27 [Hibiscus syriacus]|uniref:Homeobox-leucine zipper protein HOX27 n=1 Tax=Hibiscus syriacus TaxID=106335 RepID=A0A6A2Z1H4_HIBSY|nr:Homeobox-leucine zipper protein HOX27 [Hibiscus syriacus]